MRLEFQDTVITGLHAVARDRARNGNNMFNYHRVLMQMSTKAGKPKYGERFSSGDLAKQCGLTREGVHDAVATLRRKGVGILTAPYPGSGDGEYFIPRSQEEAMTAIEARRVQLRGGVEMLGKMVGGISADFPELVGQIPVMLTEAQVLHGWGQYGLDLARRLNADQEGQHALQAASA